MLKIRLQRIGAKNQPVYRIVVTDRRTGPKSGKHVEVVGTLDARRSSDKLIIKKDRIKYWLDNGAKPSDTVHNHLVDAGVISGAKINVLPKKTAQVSAEKEKEEAAGAEKAGEPVSDNKEEVVEEGSSEINKEGKAETEEEKSQDQADAEPAEKVLK